MMTHKGADGKINIIQTMSLRTCKEKLLSSNSLCYFRCLLLGPAVMDMVRVCVSCERCSACGSEVLCVWCKL